VWCFTREDAAVAGVALRAVIAVIALRAVISVIPLRAVAVRDELRVQLRGGFRALGDEQLIYANARLHQVWDNHRYASVWRVCLLRCLAGAHDDVASGHGRREHVCMAAQ